MAIYDYDGTSTHEIGKIYDYDGTTTYQIGKVYDYDGTSTHLIYSAEEIILNNNDYATAITGGYVGGNKPNGAYQDGVLVSSGVELPVTAYIQKTMWTNNAINLSQYSKMTVTYTVSNSYNPPGVNTARGYGIVANSSKNIVWSAPNDDKNVTWGTRYQWSKFMSHINYNGVNAGTTDYDIANGQKTVVIDISGWTGSHHIGLVASCNDANQITVTFNKIVLE